MERRSAALGRGSEVPSKTVRLEVDRTAAGRSCREVACGGRKVRAPQDRVVGNADRL